MTFIAPIDVKTADRDITLAFAEEVRDDGARICALYNRLDGEIREQIVIVDPERRRFRQTIENRMRRQGVYDMTPRTLIPGS